MRRAAAGDAGARLQVCAARGTIARAIREWHAPEFEPLRGVRGQGGGWRRSRRGNWFHYGMLSRARAGYFVATRLLPRYGKHFPAYWSLARSLSYTGLNHEAAKYLSDALVVNQSITSVEYAHIPFALAS